jgi:excinuclease UvrABC ATPase subunit
MTENKPSSRQHPADSHDLIRVRGARENNLKDVSVELPKRRLTVFTGVSGSGKSSLVFGTIAAESQRLINETYSAFVQGFMPTQARPEVDVLDEDGETRVRGRRRHVLAVRGYGLGD